MAIFTGLGVLPEMLRETLLWNITYVAAPPAGQTFLPMAFRQSLKVFTGSQAGLWLAGFGGVLLLARVTWLGKRRGLLGTWLVVSVAGVALGNARFNNYYYVALVPPLALCGGFALVDLCKRSTIAGRLWLGTAVATLLILSGESQAQIVELAWYSRVVSTTRTPEEFIGGQLRGTAPLFIWGNAAQVYALSGRPPATPYLQTLALSNDFGMNPSMQQERNNLLRLLKANPPTFIAIDTPWLKANNTTPFPELNQFINQNYTLYNDPTSPIIAGWEVYRVRDT